MLVTSVRVGADRQRQRRVARRYPLQRVADCLRTIVDELPTVDEISPLFGNHDLELIGHFVDDGFALRLGQRNGYLRFLDEARRDHEEDQ